MLSDIEKEETKKPFGNPDDKEILKSSRICSTMVEKV